MKKFLDYLQEEAAKTHGLHVFDVDDTLFHTTAKIRVMKGKKQVASLSNSEYNTHKLPAGHHYDYSEFRSAEKFDTESKPNQRMIQKMKQLHDKTKKGGGKVIINTARADFDDKDRFLDAFRKQKVDIDNIHVHRNQIQRGNYKHVSLYDDSEQNLKSFLELKKEFPHINFNAHHVKPDGKSKRYTG
jgi:FMN phosphatase YigB (HAD superfamily)